MTGRDRSLPIVPYHLYRTDVGIPLTVVGVFVTVVLLTVLSVERSHLPIPAQ